MDRRRMEEAMERIRAATLKAVRAELRRSTRRAAKSPSRIVTKPDDAR